MNCRLGVQSQALWLSVVALFSGFLTGCGSNSSGPAASTVVNNTATVTAGFGPNGPSGGIVNGLFTTVTVCQHGSTTCVSIPDVQVDTGSVGLRLLPSALGTVMLTPIAVSGSPLEECIQYGDTSYSWGPMELADVQIAGERAAGIAVQVLGGVTPMVPPSASSPASNGAYCLTNPVNPNLPNGGNEDTLASLGANGILGIGNFVFDCGSGCTSQPLSFTQGYPYYICPNGTCQGVGVPTPDQAENPIAAFGSLDNSGVAITLPVVPPGGSGSVSGTMNFGIGTRSNNNLGNAKVFALDQCGSLPTVTFNNVSYSDTSCTQNGSGLGGYFDTGSNALYVSDAATLASEGIPISDCAQGTAGVNFYCVTGGGTATLSNINLLGYLGVGSGTITLNINDATTLFKTNNAVFNDLGSDSGTSISTDFFDMGMPFFLGKTVFVGIEGQSTPVGISAPNGFVAF